MDFITITKENLADEHICCAIANNKDCQVQSKKAWLADRLDEGLIFLKANVRGKCFIEYIPAENAWAPISAPDYMYIDCLWVSGQFKGQGFSSQLLDACIQDSKNQGKKGLVILSSPKKMGFLADQKYLKYKRFITVDQAAPYFELMTLPFTKDAELPTLKPCAKQDLHANMPPGYSLYYTNQCPFTAKYVPLLAETAQKHQVPLQVTHITTKEQAQDAPCVFTTFSLFHDGKFLTHEIQSEGKFAKILLQMRKHED